MYTHQVLLQKNKDEGIIEYVKLLNEKDKELHENKKEIRKIHRQLDFLSKRLQIKNINNGNLVHGSQQIFHNTNSFNFQLLNYNDTNYDHLTDKDYINCITDCNHCVKTLIQSSFQ